jgi:hypothetical protein
MSYNINLVPNIAPIGTVMQYIGATDPNGWTICDGQARSNASGIYNNLITYGFIYNGSTTSLNTTFTPYNLANTTTNDGTTLKYIIKY